MAERVRSFGKGLVIGHAEARCSQAVTLRMWPVGQPVVL